MDAHKTASVLICSHFFFTYLTYPPKIHISFSILPWLSCPRSPVYAALSWHPCPGTLVLAVLFRQCCPDRPLHAAFSISPFSPVLRVLSCLSCSVCPALSVLFCLSFSMSFSACPVLTVRICLPCSCLSCSACLALPVQFCLSSYVCPVLPVLLCQSCSARPGVYPAAPALSHKRKPSTACRTIFADVHTQPSVMSIKLKNPRWVSSLCLTQRIGIIDRIPSKKSMV
jgi:hypothetical protein